MKYTVKVAHTSYEVEIEDIHARPVVAHVNGERFEVQPESGTQSLALRSTKEIQPVEIIKPSTNQGQTENRELTAPLPGTIVEVFERVSREAIAAAHENPAVRDLWKRFEAVCCKTPANLAEFQNMFAHFEPV